MRRDAAILALAAASLLATAGPAGAAPSLRVGFGDGLFAAADPAVREGAFEDARAAGASLVRVNVGWARVAPKHPPAGFVAADPASPGYAWSSIDAAVRGAAAHGLAVMITVSSAPVWAEGANRPAGAPAGTWKPRPGAFGAFAEAVATRYDGHFPDPATPGAHLPRVRYFEAWNEPNLSTYLTPQWEGKTPVGPVTYRALLDDFYAGVKRAQPGAKVIGGSLAPFGDPPGGERVPPVVFLRRLLCLRGGRLRTLPCPRPARLDALSDHPIAVGSPHESAASPLDVTTPDLGRLTAILRRAEATGRVLPHGRKPLWVTEFWYDSKPPDPHGLSLLTQARWYEQDLHSFWRQGARVAITLQIRDQPPGKGYALTNQSGVYFLDGSPKPSATAFRFPLVAHRLGPFQVGIWGIAPRAGRVAVQIFRSGRWKTVTTVHAAGPGRPFETRIQLLRFAKVRATIAGETSLPWTQR